jgi:hypothetical protein
MSGILPQNYNLRGERSIIVDWRATGLLRPPDEQGPCGSCWAFGSTHAFDDYRSIAANSVQEPTSVRRLLSCCEYSGCFGCHGARSADVGFLFLQKQGTVLNSCQPYSDNTDNIDGPTHDTIGTGHPIGTSHPIGATGHIIGATDAIRGSDHPKSDGERGHIKVAGICDLLTHPQCSDVCANSDKILSAPNYQLSSFAVIEATEAKMQEALQTGPLIATMTVYHDFYTYKEGIYHHVTGQEVGRHLVEVVGYGRENGVNFWICKNSWGVEWGEGGYFRIRAGVQESGIEHPGSILSPFVPVNHTTTESESPVSLIGVYESVDVENEDIIEAAKFAGHELDPFCPGEDTDPDFIHSNMALISVDHATRKVIGGEQLTLTATYQEPGCPVTTSVEVTIVRTTDGHYSLLESRYVPPRRNVSAAPRRHTVSGHVVFGIAIALVYSSLF